MKIKSVRLTVDADHCVCHHDVGCQYESATCRPGRWYDERTARLMERAVRFMYERGGFECLATDAGYQWRDQWAKLTEKATEASKNHFARIVKDT